MRIRWWRFALVWLAAVVAWTTWAAPASAEDPCATCDDTHVVACPTCKGKNVAQVTCATCDGAGRSRCPGRRADLASLGRGDGLPASVEALVVKLFGWHKGTERPCPNLVCVAGTVRFDDGKSYKCRLCGGDGRVKCRSCTEAATPCVSCKGKKKTEGPCTDCGATGSFPCAECADPEQPCTRCRDSKVTCKTCDGARDPFLTCDVCDARGRVACDKCAGIGNSVCEHCAGTARYRTRYEDGSTASSSKCDSCEERGFVDCTKCDKGLARCVACGGAKEASAPCRTCNNAGTDDCRACGNYRARTIEVTAAVQEKAGRTDAAVAALRAALAAADVAASRADANVAALFKTLPAAVPPPPDAAPVETVRKTLADLISWVRRIAAAEARAAEARVTRERIAKSLARLEPPAAPATK